MTKTLELLLEHLDVSRKLEVLLPHVDEISARMITALQDGGKICWLGNGGSAADCQHLAAEFVGRFKTERRGLASIALTTDSSVLTAVSNDYGFDRVFSRQVEALCTAKDVVVALSTSGNSPNVLKAVLSARRIGALTVGLSGGSGGRLARITDLSVVVPSSETARIQEAHILIGHILCEIVEQELSATAEFNGQPV